MYYLARGHKQMLVDDDDERVAPIIAVPHLLIGVYGSLPVSC